MTAPFGGTKTALFYRAEQDSGRMAKEGHRHAQEPTPNATKTGDQVRPSAEEDAETEGPGKEAK
jgi:hypothetical protein